MDNSERRRRGGLIRFVPRLDSKGNVVADAVPSFIRDDGTRLTPIEKVCAYPFANFMRVHPCLGARSVTGAGNAFMSVYPDMHSVETAIAVLRDLDRYFELTDGGDPIHKTLALTFIYSPATEESFGLTYWDFVQLLHDLDCQQYDYPENISTDPAAKTFELCLRGRPIFTTTRHPAQRRLARHVAYPTWVMNQTSQFNALRDKELMPLWQRSIRARDAELDPSGTYNPILADHGQASAAPQLPGIDINPCPFRPRVTDAEKRVALQRVLERARFENADPSTLAAIVDLGK